MKLQGKAAIVTESGSGIGKETAKVLARERAKVSVVGWEVFDLPACLETASSVPTPQSRRSSTNDEQ